MPQRVDKLLFFFLSFFLSKSLNLFLSGCLHARNFLHRKILLMNLTTVPRTVTYYSASPTLDRYLCVEICGPYWAKYCIDWV